MSALPNEAIAFTTQTSPLVAVVILNWNGQHFLEKMLPSVVNSTYANKKVIVADNASTDDSISFLKTHYPQIEIIINPTNEGFAKGYNTALQQVTADYYVLLNSDVEVTPSWMEPVISLMENDKSIAACQPKILDYNNKQLFEYAGAAGGFIDKFGYPFARGRIMEHIEKDVQQYDDATACFWATGAALFVKASLYHQLGGLDEYFFAHQEEIDFCWRLQNAGYQIYVQPQSIVYHVGGGTLPKGNSKKTFLNFRNNLIMLYKNYSFKKLCFVLPIRFGLDAVAAYKALFSGDTGFYFAVAKAHFQFFKWVLFVKKQPSYKKNTAIKLVGMYNGSMLWQYYIKKQQTFSKIFKSK
ncbi:glycosyltransferase family 2 protein [Ferruginibacter yonginensis]|uniref:Glycosyltransferase family 2 protein n=1 Tax=Ferruginibacter yonginensis TaxID=1310416 RepID=A0ABV8QUA2_9BACT